MDGLENPCPVKTQHNGHYATQSIQGRGTRSTGFSVHLFKSLFSLGVQGWSPAPPENPYGVCLCCFKRLLFIIKDLDLSFTLAKV